jgi:hypothetical protein
MASSRTWCAFVNFVQEVDDLSDTFLTIGSQLCVRSVAEIFQLNYGRTDRFIASKLVASRAQPAALAI